MLPFLNPALGASQEWSAVEGIEKESLVRKRTRFRLVLSVQLLQKSAAVEVDAWSIEPAPRHERPGSAKSFSLIPRPEARAW